MIYSLSKTKKALYYQYNQLMFAFVINSRSLFQLQTTLIVVLI